ncbi:MAG: methyltransferase domain-containing protein [Deltaproteobacteria bacterium]|nr:methyltransferase domain-containing protein [Deltaproteobacteria bacterium]
MKKFYQITKGIAIKFDNFFGTRVKESGGRIYRYVLRILSPVRRILDPAFICFYYKTGIKTPENLCLHLGCGWKHFDGYLNVDLWITDATDVICDITKLPWPDNSATIIESYHVIEHISHKKIKRVLTEWYRVLKPQGKLILECPHFDVAVQEYLAGNEHRLINIFGQQRSTGDYHFYGFNPPRLTRLLEEVGFKDIQESIPQSSQSLDEPSFRIECKKADEG